MARLKLRKIFGDPSNFGGYRKLYGVINGNDLPPRRPVPSIYLLRMVESHESDVRSAPDPRRVEEFVSLFTRYSPWLRGYVLSLVPNWADAEEVLQDTNAVLWKKFEQFAPGSDFFAWACQVARNEVMRYRRGKGRERVKFGDNFLTAVADEAVAIGKELDGMGAALSHCLSLLPVKDRQLVEERYRDGATTQSTAGAVGRSVDAVYKALARVRKSLLKCIQSELQRGEVGP